MSSKWWTHSWNPVIGCTPASPGCDHCYAKALHDQRHAAFVAGSRVPACYAKPFEQVTCLEERLGRPLGWKKPRRVFVNSMSDLFHPDVPFEFLDRVFAVMALASQHTFMVLTKRPERMREYIAGVLGEPIDTPRDFALFDAWRAVHGEHCGQRSWPLSNVWLGVTAESQEQADARIPILLDTPAAKRFVSVEPMLGPVDVSPWLPRSYECALSCGHRQGESDLPERCCQKCGFIGPDDNETWGYGDNAECPECGEYDPEMICPKCGTFMVQEHPGTQYLDWVICGGESGPGARPMHPDWARGLRDQCAAAGVPFFFKQWGEWESRPPGQGTKAIRSKGLSWAYVSRVGSRRAGRLLDGVEHNAMPEVLHA